MKATGPIPDDSHPMRVAFWCVVLLFFLAGAVFNLGRIPELNTRSNYIKVRAGMRAVAAQLEAYQAEYRTYPPGRALKVVSQVPEKLIKAGGEHWATWDAPLELGNVDYTDPFSPKKQLPYAYIANTTGGLLLSPGPDERYDLQPPQWAQTPNIEDPAMINLTYDPTNGSYSTGDIFRAFLLKP